jgi:sodium/bile acid cotransporter 7
MFFLFGFMAFGWWCMKTVFKDQPRLVVMGFFGAHHKTVAMGIPLIKAIYYGNPKMGLYILPLLIWHPIQLLVGSALTPRLKLWVMAEEERLYLESQEPEAAVKAEEPNSASIFKQ